MDNKDNISTLYGALKSKGYEDIGNEDQFREWLNVPDNVNTLYSKLQENKFDDIGTQDEFSSWIGISSPSANVSTAQLPVSAETNSRLEMDPAMQRARKRMDSELVPEINVMDNDKMATVPLVREESFVAGNARPIDTDRAMEEILVDSRIAKQGELQLPKDSENNIITNYQNRFLQTSEGKRIVEEFETKRKELSERAMNAYLQSEEYKNLASRYSGEDLDKKANEDFERRYGTVIARELQPLYERMNQSMLGRYKDGIEEELKNLGKENAAKQVESLSSDVSNMLQGRREALKRYSGSGNNAMNALMGSRRYNHDTQQARGEIATLEAARNFLQESQDIINEAREKGSSGALFRGLRDATFDVDTWTLGLSDMAHGYRLKEAADKADKGETLTVDEQKLLEAAAVNMAVHAYYSSDLSRMYKAGQTTGYSIPFMLEFAINPVSGSGNAIAKGILKYGMKKFGRSAGASTLNNFGKMLTSGVGRTAGRLIGDATAAAAMTGTSGLGRVSSGMLERMNGIINFDVNEEGRLIYNGREEQKGMGEALAKSAASNFLENQSEMVFNAFKGMGDAVYGTLDKVLPNGIRDFFSAVGSSEIGKLYKSLKNNPTFMEAAKRTQFHGFVGEYMEEVYNNFANVPLGEMTMDEVLDLDNNIDTALGLAPTSVMFGLLGMGGMARERYNTRKAMEKAFGKLTPDQRKRLKELQQMSNKKGNEDIREFIKATIADESLTQEQKRDEIEYAFNIAKGNAIEDLTVVETEDNIEKATAYIEENSDRKEGMYKEASRRVFNVDTGNFDLQPGCIVGEMGGQPIWRAEGSTENVPLTWDDIDKDTMQQMPVDEVVSLNAEMIRDEAKAQAERETMFSPDIPEPAIGTSFLNSNGQQVQIVQQNPDGGWIGMAAVIDEKGQPETDKNGQPVMRTFPVMDDEYYAAMQARIDTQEGVKKMLSDGRTAVATSTNGEEVSFDILDNTGGLVDSGVMPFEEFDKLDNYIERPEVELTDEGIPASDIMPEKRGKNAVSSPTEYNRMSDSRALVGRKLDSQEANDLITAMQDSADTAPELELTPENWIAEFGEDGVVDTPIGQVKMGENQLAKMFLKKRGNEFGMIKPTLTNPDLIIEEESEGVNEEVERATTLLFAKTFLRNGKKIRIFTSVTVQRDGMEVVVSNHILRDKQLTDRLERGKILWNRFDFGSDSSGKNQGLVAPYTNNPSNVGHGSNPQSILPLSDNKDSGVSGEKQELSTNNIGDEAEIQEQKPDLQEDIQPTGIPTDEKGNPLYYLAPIEVTLADLNDGSLASEEVDSFISANKTEALKLLKRVSEKPPKIGTNKAKYLADKQAWQAKVEDAQKQSDYWNEVEAQMRLLRQQPGDTTAEDIKAMGEPMTGEELAAMMLGAGKLPLLHSEYKRETGFGNTDAKRMFGLFASKEKGGMTIEQAGEQLMLADLEAGTNFFDQNDPNAGRNAIIDVLSSARTRSGLIDYIKNNREAMAERERQAEIEAEELAKEQWLQDITHMTSEERDLWKQGELLTESSVVPNDGIIEFYNTFVDDILNEEAYDSRRERTDDHRIEEGQSNELGGIYGSREGGYEVLQGEEFVSPGRTEGYQGEPGEVAGRSNESLHPTDDGLQDSSSGREVRVDNQGNPIDAEGNLIVDEVESISDITDMDFINPGRTIGLPAVPDNVSNAIGADGKRVVIKKNIFERNIGRHSDLSPSQSRDILSAALYSPNIYGQNQKTKKPYNWVLINTVDGNGNHRLVLLEVNRDKNNVEIVHWHYTDERGVEKIRRQAEREDGQLLILPSIVPEEVGALSDPTLDLSSADKDSEVQGEKQEKVSFVAPSWIEGESVLDYAERVNDARLLHEEEQRVDTNPTDAQKEAGNYRKGHIKVDGFNITIENPRGSERSGVDADGNTWSVTMNNTYGYIKGTEGVDGDHIDVFLGNSGNGVYVVDQMKEDGSFDEHKVMYGFDSLDEAREAYLSNYSPGWKGLGSITGVSKETFKEWVESSHRKTKPFADYKIVRERTDVDSEGSASNKQDNIRFREESSMPQEEQEIIDRAKKNGTYLMAPNGKPSSLGESQWVQVRTKAFKKWFGDWEKAAHIEKLRNSNPVKITGEEYKGLYDLTRESAQQYILDNLRGEYTINDTGEKVKVSKKGAKKVTSHSQGNEAHMQSIVAIPELIGNSVFIEERPAYKDNAQYDSYRYYVTGLKIGGEDYTARITIGVKNGEFYYDHYLTNIEKGNLIKAAQSFKSTEDAPNPSYANNKDNILFSLLQTNSSKVIDENGEPLVVFHGTPLRRDQITSNRGWQKDGFTYISQEAPFYTFKGGEYSGMIFTSVDAEKARSIAEKRAMSILDDENGKEQWTDEGYVYDLFANIRKPFVSSSDYEPVLALFGNRIPTLSFIGGKGEMVSLDEAKSILKSGNSWLVTETPQFVEKIKELGFDGVIGTDEGIKYIACFGPNQLKDAYDNTGEFSSENDDIRFREVREKDGSKSLVGLHNISEEKLLKALKLGGFANPSAAVIDIDRQSHEGYGEISLVLPSSMVAKSTGRNAGTFSGDAWTPTYPQIERQFTDEGSKRVYDDISKLPQEMQPDVRSAWNNYMEGRDANALAYQFLYEKGEAPELRKIEPVFSEDIRKKITGADAIDNYDNRNAAILEAYIDEKFDGDRAKFEEYIETRKRVLRKKIDEDPSQKGFVYRRAVENLKDIEEKGYEYSSVKRFYDEVMSDIRNSGGIDTYHTVRDVQEKISQSVELSKEYDEWKENLTDKYGIKEVLFKGYTSSGNRVYLPHTLENVSRLMRQQGLAGATGWGGSFSKFAAGLMKPVGTLNSIRKQKGKLTANHEDLEAFREKWEKVYLDLGLKLNPGASAYDDTGLYRVEEIATRSNPKSFAKREYGVELSDEDVRQLEEMTEAIRNDYPAMYFETKFERPVYLNEFAAVVLPDNVNPKVIGAARDAGLQIFSYESGDEVSRDEAVKKASKIDGVRFRDMRTYHGSGAYFDRFDTSHSGEGQGENMIGKGVYTTESKRIAKNYADVARNKDADGKKHLYEVNIPKDNGRNYLDYDKMYDAKEREEVTERLHDAGIDIGKSLEGYFHGREVSGMNLYRALSMNMPQGTDINEALSKAGYVGYKYSTRHDLGGKNKLFSKKSYVVFDEVNATITGHEQIVSEIEKLSDTLHTPVKVVRSMNELPEGMVRRAIEKGRNVKGWFDTRSGEVVIYLPNTTGEEDAKATFLHEIVGHKGLRALLGEKEYDQEMVKLYGQLPLDVRKSVAEAAIRDYGGNVSIAMDEYLAEQAEKDETPSWWNKVVSGIRNFLRRMGIKVDLNANDVKYLLWRSRKVLENGDILEQAEDIAMRYRLGIGEHNNSLLHENYENIRKEIEHLQQITGRNAYLARNEDELCFQMSVDGVSAKDIDYIRSLFESARRKGIKLPGLFDNETGKVYLCADQINDRNEVRGYWFHEEGHASTLLNFSQTELEALYDSIGENTIMEIVPSIYFEEKLSKSILADEYISYLMEEIASDEELFNSLLEGKVDEVLGELEFLSIDIVPFISKNLKLILYGKEKKNNRENRSGHSLRTLSSEKTGMEARGGTEEEGSIRFRTGENGEERPSDGTIESYEKALSKRGLTGFRAQEASQDSMLSLKILQDIILAKDGGKIKSFEDAYKAENRMSSVSTREMEVYAKDYFRPVVEEVARIIRDEDTSYVDVTDYLIAKHGLERNVALVERDAAAVADKTVKEKIDSAYKELKNYHISQDEYNKVVSQAHFERDNIYKDELEKNQGKDYSGLTGLKELRTGEKSKDKDYIAFAEAIVSDFESKHNTDELWSHINNATNQSLRKTYESGLMSKEQYESLLGRFEYYVPLRGWDETMADEVYEYMDKQRSPVNSVLKNAKGRISLADDPIAAIGNMAESTILQGNRNLMKQNFLNFVINHPSDLAQVRELWYVKDNTTGEFVPSFPDISENASPEEIAYAVDEHEETMKHLEKDGLAKRGRNGLELKYKILPFQKSEHVVMVKRNGKDVVIYINADPRAAQAINGLTNPDVENNPILKAVNRFNRMLAANFTTRNPAFVISNLSRDMIFATSAVAVKESPMYLARFSTNIPIAIAAVFRGIRKKGGNSEADKYFQEFLDNGGETGYAQLNTVDKYKKMIQKDINRLTKTDYFGMIRNGIELLEDFNRMAEDISRFTTYMTSRQEGRNILEAINDAKEITVNFNKKGAGYKSLNQFEKWYSAGNLVAYSTGVMKNLYLFFNVGVQSLFNFGRLHKKSVKKFGAMLGGFTSAGFMMPLINTWLMALGGDDKDGEDYYGNLSDWTRRNNLCLYIPGSHGHFVTIPLPIELRAFFGLGDMAYQETIGEGSKNGTEIAYDAINQLTELLPLNPLGNNGDIVSTVMPDAIKPFWQVVKNEDYTGRPIYKSNSFNKTMPKWTKTYKGTSKQLIKLAEWSNELGGGDKYKTSPAIFDWNPAVIEHILEGYFGGMATIFNQSGKTMMAGIESVIDGERSDDLIWRNTPVLSRFINDASDERSGFRKFNESFYKYLDEYQETEKLLHGYTKEVLTGNLDYLDKLVELQKSKDYVKYSVFKNLNQKVDKIRQLEKKVGDGNNKDLRKQINELKKKVVEEMEKVK